LFATRRVRRTGAPGSFGGGTPLEAIAKIARRCRDDLIFITEPFDAISEQLARANPLGSR
jgi:hypothetical protein